jgi:hypothetical protein
MCRKIKAEFSRQIIVNKRVYYDELFYKNNYAMIYQVNFDRKDDLFLKGIEYLSSIYLRSKCHALVA